MATAELLQRLERGATIADEAVEPPSDDLHHRPAVLHHLVDVAINVKMSSSPRCSRLPSRLAEQV
jgi:hypothetical protein